MAMEWPAPAHPYSPIDPVLGPNRGSKPDQYATGFWAGILGALVMTLLVGLARVLGLTSLNLEMTLGSLLTQTPTAGAWWLGFVWHLLNGGIFALAYVWGFGKIKRSGAKIGIEFGLIHWIAAGVFLGLLPELHPLIPDQMPAPGWFASNLGIFEMVTLLLLHCVYGAIVGGLHYANIRYGMMTRGEESKEIKVA